MRWPDDFINKVIQGDCLEVMKHIPDEAVQTVVTSPPYWGLRDYGVDGQIGLEPTPEMYVERLVEIFREVRRALRSDGTAWLNLGDSHNTTSGYCRANDEWFRDGRKGGSADKKAIDHPILKPKDLVGIPWRVAFALQADGWWLRSDIIWSKPNPMPESVTDRPTRAHEYIFLLSKSAQYFYDSKAIAEPPVYLNDDRKARARESHKRAPTDMVAGIRPRKTDKQRGHERRHAGFNDRWDQMTKAEQQALGRNKRSVWEVATQPFPEAHFAVYPKKLIQPCILAGSKPGDIVLDPFSGAGTTALVAKEHGRKFIAIDISLDYNEMANKRLRQEVLF